MSVSPPTNSGQRRLSYLSSAPFRAHAALLADRVTSDHGSSNGERAHLHHDQAWWRAKRPGRQYNCWFLFYQFFVLRKYACEKVSYNENCSFFILLFIGVRRCKLVVSTPWLEERVQFSNPVFFNNFSLIAAGWGHSLPIREEGVLSEG